MRRASAACLRQLAQREAREVCEHALTLARENANSYSFSNSGAYKHQKDLGNVGGLVITETGLPGVLFVMLDVETDQQLISDIHDILISMLQSLAEHNLRQWLSLCKDVLTATGISFIQICV